MNLLLATLTKQNNNAHARRMSSNYQTSVPLKMANVRDSDTSLWLHNKLGISNDSWTGGSICSQLNVEVLRNIKECFPDLQTQVKLKLLLSFFHIPRRNLEEVCLCFWNNLNYFALCQRYVSDIQRFFVRISFIEAVECVFVRQVL